MTSFPSFTLLPRDKRRIRKSLNDQCRVTLNPNFQPPFVSSHFQSKNNSKNLSKKRFLDTYVKGETTKHTSPMITENTIGTSMTRRTMSRSICITLNGAKLRSPPKHFLDIFSLMRMNINRKIFKNRKFMHKVGHVSVRFKTKKLDDQENHVVSLIKMHRFIVEGFLIPTKPNCPTRVNYKS